MTAVLKSSKRYIMKVKHNHIDSRRVTDILEQLFYPNFLFFSLSLFSLSLLLNTYTHTRTHARTPTLFILQIKTKN